MLLLLLCTLSCIMCCSLTTPQCCNQLHLSACLARMPCSQGQNGSRADAGKTLLAAAFLNPPQHNACFTQPARTCMCCATTAAPPTHAAAAAMHIPALQTWHSVLLQLLQPANAAAAAAADRSRTGWHSASALL
jgi:hypothetical protein